MKATPDTHRYLSIAAFNTLNIHEDENTYGLLWNDKSAAKPLLSMVLLAMG
jgi:hypothetical protein